VFREYQSGGTLFLCVYFCGLNGFSVIVTSSRRGSQWRSSGLISIARHRQFTQRLIFGKLPLQPLAGRLWLILAIDFLLFAIRFLLAGFQPAVVLC
jgi:hypothetical protein